jgi:O-antigen/teichoic acid export membrane protein
MQYRDLPLANTPQMLVELVQLYGIIFLLQALYSPEIVGWYSLSQRLLQAPMWLIGTSLSQVYYKDASERFSRDGNLVPMIKKTIKMSTLVALPVLIVMLTIGPWLIGFIFGEAWRESGEIARILAPWFFFDFIRYSVAQTPLIIGKTTHMFFISVCGSVLLILAVVAGALFFNSVSAAFVLLSVMLSCYSIAVIWWMVRTAKNILPHEHH